MNKTYLFFFMTLLLWCDLFSTDKSPILENEITKCRTVFQQAHKTALYEPVKAKKLYLNCALKLEALIKQYNLKNQTIYYNTGNAFYFAGEMGKSIFYLRLAELNGDSFPELQNNLAQVRLKRADQLPAGFEWSWLRYFHFYTIPDHVVKSGIALSWIMIFILLILKIKSAKYSSVIIYISLVCFLLTSSIYLSRQISSIQSSDGVIISPRVIARKGDAYIYEASFVRPLHSGTEFQLIEERGSWVYVRLSDAKTCWLPKKSVEVFTK